MIGGVAGLLAGVGVVPALAGIMIGGPIAAALGLAGAAALTVSGAVTGAVAGGLIGGLTKLGLSHEDAEYYDRAVESGSVVIGVPVSDENEDAVRNVLEDYQGEDIKTAPATGTAKAATQTTAANGMTRSEEELVVNKQTRERGRVRLVKHVITENVIVTVPLRKEVAHLERETIVDGQRVPDTAFNEESQEIVLNEEVADVQKRAVAKERVNLATDVEETEQHVSEQVRKERVDVESDEL